MSMCETPVHNPVSAASDAATETWLDLTIDKKSTIIRNEKDCDNSLFIATLRRAAYFPTLNKNDKSKFCKITNPTSKV